MKQPSLTQNTSAGNGSLDVFRMIAAFLVVAIHTSPLASYSAEGDFFLTRILARIAVPFFFLVTGQFVLSEYLSGRKKDFLPVGRYLKKILFLYGICMLLYLPIGIYAGHYAQLTAGSLIRMILFDGNFYHLWYFPALLTGILLVCVLRRFCSRKTCTLISVFLYLLGLLGDSYWGMISGLPVLSAVYNFGFGIFSYTRNGIFFAPLFLVMGAQMKPCGRPENRTKDLAGFLIAFLLMTGEGFFLRYLQWQRHDSMYLLLPVCMFFFYRLLLSLNRKPAKVLRNVSAWIYIIHPAMIVVVRSVARILKATELLVDNSLLHYFAVSLLSASFSFALVLFRNSVKKKRT